MLRVVAWVRLTLFCGNVCWAKPNHGFFNCQHPCSDFFSRRAPRPAPDVRRDRDARIGPCARAATVAAIFVRIKTHKSSCFSCNARHAARSARSTHASVAGPRAHRRERVPRLSAGVAVPRFPASHEPDCAKVRKKFRAVGKPARPDRASNASTTSTRRSALASASKTAATAFPDSATRVRRRQRCRRRCRADGRAPMARMPRRTSGLLHGRRRPTAMVRWAQPASRDPCRPRDSRPESKSGRMQGGRNWR